MRIGPGGAGSSCFSRVSVSESRIDPPQALFQRERLDHGPELRAPVAARQGEAQGTQVAADRLQLPDDLAAVDAAVRALDELAEPFQRRPRLFRQPRGLGLE